MSGRAVGALLGAVAVAVCFTGCRSETPSLRVAVLTECDGAFAQTRPATLAGAALPLVERGARPGATPGDVENATVAGVRVELVPGCTATIKLSRLIAET